jgi:hypothetical protein
MVKPCPRHIEERARKEGKKMGLIAFEQDNVSGAGFSGSDDAQREVV